MVTAEDAAVGCVAGHAAGGVAGVAFHVEHFENIWKYDLSLFFFPLVVGGRIWEDYPSPDCLLPRVEPVVLYILGNQQQALSLTVFLSELRTFGICHRGRLVVLECTNSCYLRQKKLAVRSS